jgi:hypothetical protein
MQITVQVIDGCPYRALAQQRLREALRDGAGTPIFVTVEEIVDEDHCRRIGFRGSPTFLIDGRDPFVEGTQVIGLRCRVYDTEAGRDHAPSVDQLRRAINPD